MINAEEKVFIRLKRDLDKVFKYYAMGSFNPFVTDDFSGSGSLTLYIPNSELGTNEKINGVVSILVASQCKPLKPEIVELKEKKSFHLQGMYIKTSQFEPLAMGYSLRFNFRNTKEIAKFDFMTEDGTALKAIQESVINMGHGATQITSYSIVTDKKNLTKFKILPYQWVDIETIEVPIEFEISKVEVN